MLRCTLGGKSGRRLNVPQKQHHQAETTSVKRKPCVPFDSIRRVTKSPTNAGVNVLHVKYKRLRGVQFFLDFKKNTSMLVFVHMRTRGGIGVGSGGHQCDFFFGIQFPADSPCRALHGDLPKFPNIAVNLWVLTSGQHDTEHCPPPPVLLRWERQKQP